MELDELFVPIPYFENYAVSNYGTVINVESGEEVRSWLNTTHNRMKVRMPVHAAYVEFFIDDLVTEAFFVNWRPGIEIFYKNGDHTDCTVLNLTFDPKYKETDDGGKHTHRGLWIDNRGKVRATER